MSNGTRDPIPPARQGTSTGVTAGLAAFVANKLGLDAGAASGLVLGMTGLLAAVGNTARDRVHRAEARDEQPLWLWQLASYL